MMYTFCLFCFYDIHLTAFSQKGILTAYKFCKNNLKKFATSKRMPMRKLLLLSLIHCSFKFECMKPVEG